MIFVFAEDGTLDVIEDLAEARRNYEGIDVESGVFRFFNEAGQYLKPVFSKPNKSIRFLGIIPWIASGEFELQVDSGADEDDIFVCLEETSVLNSNQWFKDLDEVKNFLTKQMKLTWKAERFTVKAVQVRKVCSTQLICGRYDLTDMNLIDSLTKKDFIPFEKFGLKWRFTEEKYNVLSDEVLSLIYPLSKNKAAEFYKYSSGFLGNAALIESEFIRIISFRIVGNHEPVKVWLNQKPIDPESEIIVSWDNSDCVITYWKIFCEYWDDFCYPSSDDILIWSSLDAWILYYCHEEIFQYGIKKS